MAPCSLWITGFTHSLQNCIPEIIFSEYTLFRNIERRNTYLSLFSPNAGKYWPEQLRIRTLFTQWESLNLLSLIYLTHTRLIFIWKLHCISIDWFLYELNIDLIWLSMYAEVSFQLYFERSNKLDYEQIFFFATA